MIIYKSLWYFNFLTITFEYGVFHFFLIVTIFVAHLFSNLDYLIPRTAA